MSLTAREPVQDKKPNGFEEKKHKRGKGKRKKEDVSKW